MFAYATGSDIVARSLFIFLSFSFSPFLFGNFCVRGTTTTGKFDFFSSIPRFPALSSDEYNQTSRTCTFGTSRMLTRSIFVQQWKSVAAPVVERGWWRWRWWWLGFKYRAASTLADHRRIIPSNRCVDRSSKISTPEDEVSEGKEKKGKKKKCAPHEDKVDGRETFVITFVPLEGGKEGITGNGVVGVELRLSIGSRS